MKRRECTIQNIHMALDSEMPPKDSADFEIWLAANPDMKALSMRFAADRARLQNAFTSVLKEPVPERLLKMLSDETPPDTLGWPVSRLPWRSAAAAAFVLASAAIGYYAGVSGMPLSRNADEAVVEHAIQAHVMYASERLHVVEVGADQKDHLVGWHSKKVGISLLAPDFSTEGFRLVGGRLLPAVGYAAAQFMYQDRATYLAIRHPGRENDERDRPPEEGARAVYWIDGGFYHAVSGWVPEQNLFGMANSAYQQLRNGLASERERKA